MVNGPVSSTTSAALTYDVQSNSSTTGRLAESTTSAAFSYDVQNRLTQAGNTTYIYDAENNRISAKTGKGAYTYVYNTNSSLSQLLVRTDANGKSTYYVYGKGLISEESENGYKVYHYDLRDSTVALTNQSGKVTDRCTYGTYGEMASHTGSSNTPFLYDGRDGVMTDGNGLYYMRARYYSPLLMRFLNSDPVDGGIKDSRTLNKYAYANGNPISYTDPFGTSAELGNDTEKFAHMFLDVAGMIPGIGTVSNGISALWYLAEGDYANAALSGFCAIPFAGDVGDAVKIGKDAIEVGEDAVKVGRNAFEVGEDAEKIDRAVEDVGKISEEAGKADFYVKPNGDVIPSTGYRYMPREANYIDNLKNTMEIPANPHGTYFTFNKYDIPSPGKLQVPHDASIRGSFDTLQIIDDVRIPNGKWGEASWLEPITKDFSKYGPGGATQAITNNPIKLDNLQDILR